MENEEKKQLPITSEKPPVDLDSVYELYCLWKSLPPFLKCPPRRKGQKEDPDVRAYAMDAGIDDPVTLDLLEIKTQGEFAQRYGIHQDTCTDWNKTQGVRDNLQDIRKWARQLTRNVLMSLYQTAMKKGFATEVKLWFQLIEKWEEKMKVEHDYLGVTELVVVRGDNKSREIKNESTTDTKQIGTAEQPNENKV